MAASDLTMVQRPSSVAAAVRKQRRILWRHKDLLAGTIIIGVVLLTTLFGLMIPEAELHKVNITSRLKPPFWLPGGKSGSLMGTDQLGRDLFLRLVYGARISISVGIAATLLSALIGVPLGLLAGYVGGKVDTLLMRLIDILLAFPGIVLSIIVVSFLGPSVINIIIVLAVTSWLGYARTVRGMVLMLKQREFVEGARAIGASTTRILLRHLLPNCATLIGVIAALQVAAMILAESALSFLGLGIQPPTPTWGIMVAEGREYLDSAWWISTFPGFVIMLTALGVKFFSDGLSDVLDPRTRGAK